VIEVSEEQYKDVRHMQKCDDVKIKESTNKVQQLLKTVKHIAST
jgi:hypothetical protein